MRAGPHSGEFGAGDMAAEIVDLFAGVHFAEIAEVVGAGEFCGGFVHCGDV